jgi:hypothetical protein
MKWWGIILVIVLSGSFGFTFPLTPDPEHSPGALCTSKDSDFLDRRYPEKIPYCRRNVSEYLKKEIYEFYDIPEECRHRYTIDHIIPLALGGSNAPENLWPEHKKVKDTRPNLEVQLYAALKRGEMTQKHAIQIILREKFSVQHIKNGKSHCDKVTE